jgi:hypothetical protein
VFLTLAKARNQVDFLKGKKTYLLSTLVTLLVTAKAMGYLKMDPAQFEAILVLLGAGSIATLRASVNALKG